MRCPVVKAGVGALLPLVWCALIYDARSLHCLQSSPEFPLFFFLPQLLPASADAAATGHSFRPSPVEGTGLASGLRCDGNGVGGPWRPPRSPSPCCWLPHCSPSPLLRWLEAVSHPLSLSLRPLLSPFSLLLGRQLDPPLLILATNSKTSRERIILFAAMASCMCHAVPKPPKRRITKLI